MLSIIDYENGEYDCCPSYLEKVKKSENSNFNLGVLDFLIGESYLMDNNFENAL